VSILAAEVLDTAVWIKHKTSIPSHPEPSNAALPIPRRSCQYKDFSCFAKILGALHKMRKKQKVPAP
jgi:hypothetical protein